MLSLSRLDYLGAKKKKQPAQPVSQQQPLTWQPAPSAWPVWAPYAAAMFGVVIVAYILLKRD